MRKKQYGLIGHPIGHSMSQFVHERLFELSNTCATYTVVDIPQKTLSERIPDLNELDGYNVTIPFKRVIIQYMDKLSRKAELYGSVNTVLNQYLIEGHTTDADGFLKSLEYENVELSGRVVILGSGGLARTIGYEAVICGANTCLAVAPFDLAAAASLSGEIRDHFSNWDMDTCLIDRLSGPIDLLINATPIGMYPKCDDMPVCESILKDCKCVFDAVYNPFQTALLKSAEANGAKAISGLYMLVWQAALSHKVWYGAEFSSEDIEQLYEDTRKKQQACF